MNSNDLDPRPDHLGLSVRTCGRNLWLINCWDNSMCFLRCQGTCTAVLSKV